MKLFSISIIILISTIIFFSSCEKEDLEINDPPYDLFSTTDLSGFGNRPGKPSVTPYFFPENIEISIPILSFDTGAYNHYGYGWGGTAYFTLINNNNFNVDVTFPERLVIIADDDSSQNNILLYPIKIPLLAKESRKISLTMFCTNKEKCIWDPHYEIIGQSNNEQIFRLTNHLKNKSETAIAIIDQYSDLQDILSTITDGNGLTQADLDIISSW
ncbi:MAG TPA: hypothetical protein DDX39_08920 [Bacteroidales bacterium]|nr:MAG: hypothetical protein A2W98_06275 [Bacteroidetes bacterium GWF2_33_38]OFY68630.1 MAG: hypothetical protein A2265_06615 [Bacteroidetes bacterium RIFOXYA12_FULL_33_9]OFY85969.1 MAG: hypothetical protein A2236_00780 [Bacteroidetes bacterium RIFOXYA2_FULL_33_7]HBF88749.1 hypothetical protein [Bacteroidales bacterium]